MICFGWHIFDLVKFWHTPRDTQHICRVDKAKGNCVVANAATAAAAHTTTRTAARRGVTTNVRPRRRRRVVPNLVSH